MAKKRNLKKEREEATEKIAALFYEAGQIYSVDSDLAHRYVHLARKTAMKYKIRLSSALQKKFCKHCYKYLMPGENARIRTRDSKVIYTCFECKNFMRFPMAKEKKEKKKS